MTQSFSDRTGTGGLLGSSDPLADGDQWIETGRKDRNQVSEKVRIEIISDPARIRTLESDWKRLAARSGDPLLQFEWFTSCIAPFTPSDGLFVIVVRTNGRISAIAPLAREKHTTAHRLEIVGTSVLCEPAGLLFDDEESLQYLIDKITSLNMPVMLRRIPEDSRILRLMERSARRNAAVLLKSGSATPWIPVTGSWDEFEKTISASRRSSIRRACRRAEGLGKVTMEILSPSPEQRGALLNEALNVESAGWKSSAGSSILTHAGLRAFFDRYTDAAAAAGILRLCFLRINGRAAAVQIALESGKRFWVLKIGYDERFAECSPGIVLMHHCIRNAFEQNMTSVELLGSDEPWLRVWARSVRPCITLRLYPPTIGGIGLLAADTAGFIGREFHSLFRSQRHGYH